MYLLILPIHKLIYELILDEVMAHEKSAPTLIQNTACKHIWILFDFLSFASDNALVRSKMYLKEHCPNIEIFFQTLTVFSSLLSIVSFRHPQTSPILHPLTEFQFVPRFYKCAKFRFLELIVLKWKANDGRTDAESVLYVIALNTCKFLETKKWEFESRPWAVKSRESINTLYEKYIQCVSVRSVWFRCIIFTFLTRKNICSSTVSKRMPFTSKFQSINSFFSTIQICSYSIIVNIRYMPIMAGKVTIKWIESILVEGGLDRY